jgi:hypothetical protein
MQYLWGCLQVLHLQELVVNVMFRASPHARPIYRGLRASRKSRAENKKRQLGCRNGYLVTSRKRIRQNEREVQKKKEGETKLFRLKSFRGEKQPEGADVVQCRAT